MSKIEITRRVLLAAGGAAGLLALGGCGTGGRSASQTDPVPAEPTGSRVAYRLTTQGVRASGAAKRHASNKVFATYEAADQNRAHPGDKSRIVPIDLSAATWGLYFGAGAAMVDLRGLARTRVLVSRLHTTPALLVGACIDEAGVVVEGPEPRGVVHALQEQWGLATPGGRPVDESWVELPVIEAPGIYEATLTPPHHEPVAFTITVDQDDLCRAALKNQQALERATIKVPVLVGQDGKIFGSVTPLMLATEIRATTGIDVDRRRIKILGDPITTIGSYEAEVTFRQHFVAEITFEVVEQ